MGAGRGIYTCHSTEVNYSQDEGVGRSAYGRRGDVHGLLREELTAPSPLYLLRAPVVRGVGFGEGTDLAIQGTGGEKLTGTTTPLGQVP